MLLPFGFPLLAASVAYAWTYSNDGIATMTHYTMNVVRIFTWTIVRAICLTTGIFRVRLPVVGALAGARTIQLLPCLRWGLEATARLALDLAVVSPRRPRL
jgi:hypothetical protein